MPWFYNQHFEPKFTIGLTLRQLHIAEDLLQELEMAKEWQLFVRERDGTEKLIKTMADADKFTQPNCTLVMVK